MFRIKGKKGGQKAGKTEMDTEDSVEVGSVSM